MMNRRRFLSSVLALVAGPILASKAEIMRLRGNALFNGEVGEWHNIRIFETGADYLDGLQWTPDQISELRSLGKSPLVINRMQDIYPHSRYQEPRE